MPRWASFVSFVTLGGSTYVTTRSPSSHSLLFGQRLTYAADEDGSVCLDIEEQTSISDSVQLMQEAVVAHRAQRLRRTGEPPASAVETAEQSRVSSSAGKVLPHEHSALDAGGGSRGAAELLVALAEAELAKTAGTVEEVSMATTTTTTITTTMDPDLVAMGLTYNAKGDFEAFFTNVITNAIMVVGVIAVFCVLRVRYPIKYSWNVLKGIAPSSPDNSQYFSWLPAAFTGDTQQHMDCCGLDQAMLIKFSDFAIQVCIMVGGPLLLITSPINYIFGGHSAGEDRMSFFGLGNVRNGSNIYWVTVVAVWFTVLATTRLIWKAQEDFMHLRWQWCRRMPDIRANTVLVEGIPDEYQSDEELRKFFEVLFPGNRIKSTYVVRDTSELVKVKEKYVQALHSLEVAKAFPDSQVRIGLLSGKQDARDFWESTVKELEPRIKELRDTINEACSKGHGGQYHCGSGFVTFTSRSDAELAVRLTNISSDTTEWRIDHPPDPGDVLWVDLMQDPSAEVGRHVLGYTLVGLLYFAYMPLVVGITNIAKLVDLGPLQPFWEGIAPTFGLTLMVSFLPTFLIVIFKLFFTLKAEAWAQHRLQEWYFWFNMVFVVMATAIAQNVSDFTRTIATSPFDLFTILANSMPYATHFYIDYMAMQSVTHSMNLLRYVNLSKYKVLAMIYDDDKAAAMSEPEDQDYYGIGSRSARWTTGLVIGLVFGTLSPLIWIVTLVNFIVCRMVYGYLIPYAETRKPDLGGVFWVTQLRHLFHGLMIYSALMIGVLLVRAPGVGPMIFACPTLVYLWVLLARFDSHFSWKNLPFHELMSEEGQARRKAATKMEINDTYVQAELDEWQEK